MQLFCKKIFLLYDIDFILYKLRISCYIKSNIKKKKYISKGNIVNFSRKCGNQFFLVVGIFCNMYLCIKLHVFL